MTISLKTRMLGAAFGVASIFGGIAYAEDASSVTLTGNIAITTDYLFRGISQSNSEAAVQGGFDATMGSFYAGTWASSISFAPMELDLYAGFRPTTGPVSWDIGVIGYLYPSASDDFAEFDYYEGYVKASTTLSPGFSVGGAFYYSPDFTLETGNAYYVEGNTSIALSDSFAFSGAVGYQSIDDIDGPFPGNVSDEYLTWNAGVTYSAAGLAFDLRYVDTDISSSDPIELSGFTNDQNSKSKVVFTIKKAL